MEMKSKCLVNKYLCVGGIFTKGHREDWGLPCLVHVKL